MSSPSEVPIPDTPRVLLEHHLKALRLPTILREYDKVARQCAEQKADFPTYAERRHYVHEIYQPLIDRLIGAPPPAVPPREATGWERVDRTVEKAHARLAAARLPLPPGNRSTLRPCRSWPSNWPGAP